MTLRPFWNYYGGKWRLAPKYPAPAHGRIVEPFAGAAGYSTRHHECDVNLYDVDPTVIGVWDYLIHASPHEIRALPDVDTLDDLPGSLCQEAAWLIGWWLGSGRPSIRRRRSTRTELSWGPRVRERLAAQCTKIRHWSARLASWDDIDTTRDATWFVDPPYQGPPGRHYTFDQVNHERLGAWCRGLPGQVIVCENTGADWLDFDPLALHRGSNGKKNVEAIWCGGTAQRPGRRIADYLADYENRRDDG